MRIYSRKEDVLEKFISALLNERCYDFLEASGDIEMVSMLELAILLKEEKKIDRSFQKNLEENLLNMYFRKEKAKKRSFISEITSAILFLVGFPYVANISEEFTYGSVSGGFGLGSLHWGNSKYNYLGFSCLPILKQSATK